MCCVELVLLVCVVDIDPILFVFGMPDATDHRPQSESCAERRVGRGLWTARNCHLHRDLLREAP